MTGPLDALSSASPSSSSSSSKSTTTICHSGRAHVRGKIRRVWRPRFLQLADNGFVRYYELEQEEPHQQHKEPKSTLLIYHARIIDPTTLRDLHVGLPKGTFGFCFHARRLYMSHVNDQCHPPEHYTAPRDFLCAVSTLEEAQSWVVALQWASSLHEPTTLSVTDHYLEEEHYYSDDEDYYNNNNSAAGGLVVQHSKKKNAFLRVVNSNRISRKATARNKAPVAAASTKLGKIVVTKVRRYRFVRVVHDGKNALDIAYDIQLLLLRTSRPKIVEERTVSRTRSDLQTLLHKLRNEGLNKDDVLDQAQQVLDQLDKNALTSEKQTRNSISDVDNVMRNLSMEGCICNSTSMRNFWCITPDAPITVEAAAKFWFSLWPPRHDACALQSRKTLVPSSKNPNDFVKQWLQEGAGASNQQHVVVVIQNKMQWYLVWLLRHPTLLVPVVAALLVLIVPLVRLYQAVMGFYVHLRLDVLVMTWLVSLGIGRTYGRKRQSMIPLPTTKPTVTAALPKKAKATARPEPPCQFEEEASLLTEEDEEEQEADFEQSTTTDEEEEEHDDEEEYTESSSVKEATKLSSPLPEHPANGGVSCWSKPQPNIFRVRGETYLTDRVKVPSAPEPFVCRGVDVWLTDNPERHISRHPSVMGGKFLGEEDCFVVNFLLPFGNFVACFAIPPLDEFPDNLRQVWTKFLQGDQQYRDARLKLLPVVVDGPWIVRKAVGPGTSPALLGKVIPLQYYFNGPTDTKKGIYEVDIIITASRIAKGILSVVKGHTNMLTIAFAFIIEAAEEVELPETVLCTFQMHSLHLENCPQLPECNLDELQ